MLAINSLFKWSCLGLGTALFAFPGLNGAAIGQQTPAQRYQPVRGNVYDAPAADSKTESNADYYPERVHSENIQQIAYQQASEPAVPAILAGPKSTNPTMTRKSPADFANQMGVRPMASSAPKVGQTAIPVAVVPQVQQFINNRSLRSPAVKAEQNADRATATQAAAARTAEVKAVQTATGSANDFMAAVNQTKQNDQLAAQQTRRPVAPATPVANASAGLPESPGQTIQDTRVQPVAAQVQQTASQIKQASAQLQSGMTNLPPVASAAIKIAAPAIEVVTSGPDTIGINKPSQYKVIVRNNSTIKASRVLVGVNMPSWVDIENIALTSGGKEITDGKEQARLVWSVDQIPGNSAQTLTITAIPRKAEIFDVGVEWTLVPMVGKASIRVTEPKLEMSISGPQEVQYGETALYHVAVRNPGTGAAENVTVMLPEALGGERATLGIIAPGKEKNFQVELLARTAGDLNLVATATGENNLKTSAERALKVRRAHLEIVMNGPPLKYSGSVGKYTVTLTNTGDAAATELITAVALPEGVKYLKGIDSIKLIEGGTRWPVGALAPGQSRSYEMFCQLDTSGDLQLEVGARGKGDLAASNACITTVETIADLVLTVADLKGPLPTGEAVPYTVSIRNRGSKAATGVNLVMQFSEGIEPKAAKGLTHQIVPGKVMFSSIEQIDPGQEMNFEITAEALKSGTHIFRAQVTSDDSDVREIAEGTTRYFGDPVESSSISQQPAASTADASNNSFE